MENALYWVTGIILSWILLYYIIKAAVMNAIRDSGLVKKITDLVKENLPEDKPNTAQLSIKKKYKSGEITFDEYKSAWDKLKN